MPPPVFRFAPSPNGFLHLGHAYSALLNFDLARKSGGRFLLRIEDIDPVRCRPEFEAAMFEDLEWLGIAWEQPVRRQSEHLDAYSDGLKRLEHEGLIYSAFESRSQIKALVQVKDKISAWPRDPDNGPLYPGEAKSMPPDERRAKIKSGVPYVLRLDMVAASARVSNLSWNEQGAGPDGESGEVAAKPEQWGDVILGCKETPTSYHLSVVIDDALQGVTTCSGRPACIACFRNCSACRSRSIVTIPSYSMRAAKSFPNRPQPKGFASCARRARRRKASGGWLVSNSFYPKPVD